jgi:DNA-binding MarR family transcriptional regulator
MRLKKAVELGENEKAWMELSRAFRALERAREVELEKFGLSPIEAAVLHALETADAPVTPAKLSRWLYREPHTMSGLLNRMEEKGLVKKSKDLEKKNLVRVTITKKGEQAFQQQWEARIVPKIMSFFSKKELDNLKESLNKLEDKALGIIRDLQPLPYR